MKSILRCSLVIFILIGALGCPQEPEQENAPVEQVEPEGQAEKIKATRRDHSVYVRYYGVEKRNLASYESYLPSHSVFSDGDRGILTLWGSSYSSTEVFIRFGDEGRVRNVNTNSPLSYYSQRGPYDCDEAEYQVLCAWATMQLSAWTERLQSLGMDALVEETSRLSPLLENPEQYNVPPRS